VHIVEKLTIQKLLNVGYDLTPYLSPVPYLAPALVGPVSKVLDEVEEEEEVEE